MIVPATIAAALATGGFYLGPIVIRRRGAGILRRRAEAGRLLALTYDDGPGMGVTPRLLELLRTHGVRATFFPLGRRAEAHPDLLDALAADGHEIGCHSHHHRHAWKTLPWTAAADLRRGYETLGRWVAPDGMYRPPYGKLNLGSWLAARRRGAPLAWWSLDSGDTRAELPRTEDVVAAVRDAGGGVVLMHDHDPARDEQAEFVVRTTGRLLELAVQENMGVVTLGELLTPRAGSEHHGAR